MHLVSGVRNREERPVRDWFRFEIGRHISSARGGSGPGLSSTGLFRSRTARRSELNPPFLFPPRVLGELEHADTPPPSNKAATSLRLQPLATLISLSFSESPFSSAPRRLVTGDWRLATDRSAPRDLASSSLQFLISSSHHLELCTSAVLGDWIHDKQ